MFGGLGVVQRCATTSSGIPCWRHLRRVAMLCFRFLAVSKERRKEIT
jgi:hypothetical protein